MFHTITHKHYSEKEEHCVLILSNGEKITGWYEYAKILNKFKEGDSIKTIGYTRKNNGTSA